MFDDSLQIAQRNGDALATTHTKLGLALLASRGGDTLAAASLHSLADPIHEQLGTVTVGLEARLRDADIARLREALGDTAFDTACARAHSSEQTPWPVGARRLHPYLTKLASLQRRLARHGYQRVGGVSIAQLQ